ncbi:MauE/DoxX family redox-associated membrane protein [Vibrio sp. SCSIO 43137]|uniref:MauE/DoxX family redox-associated membrane protein n=1 Tax=Vibrio sp. SCSIO 43137 TaxID=3021011 RepID=UPI0023070BD9|nr:MauE/DoxX family redox-associated membrane protein [Vibrio sp. SCSIO 43137]WCE30824.1 hypothetical protein PK654_06025 [Vibrio sp. SCSIO 43137]
MNNAVFSNPFLKWGDFVVRFIVGGLFLVTSLHSAFQFRSSVTIVSAYGLVPEFFEPVFTAVLLVSGTVAGVMVLLGRTEGILLALTLLICFSIVAGYGVAIGLDIDCGCLPEDDPKYQAFSNLRIELVKYIACMVPLALSYWFRLQLEKSEY